jgi:hypothetical protein
VEKVEKAEVTKELCEVKMLNLETKVNINTVDIRLINAKITATLIFSVCTLVAVVLKLVIP